MINEFLTENKAAILALVKEKTGVISKPGPASEALEAGLPNFYGHLIGALARTSDSSPKTPEEAYPQMPSEYGKGLARLGCTVSQVVHSYGAICQAITETAEKKEFSIDSGEFNSLNYALDVAISEAVTGFEEARRESPCRGKIQGLGFLAHELRSALTTVSIAHQLIKKGAVGGAGQTNALLERNLTRMQEIIDRSLMEVRLRSDNAADRHPLRLIEVVDEVEATAIPQALLKGISLTAEVDPLLVRNADRHHLVSALAILVQNAIKFSKFGGSVAVRSRDDGRVVELEVEDTCGGLPPGKIEDLLHPPAQESADAAGFGHGLSICRRAVLLNDGNLAVRDIPGQGCAFSIRLPKLSLHPAAEEALG
jgi:hypothetical protein